MVYQTRGDVSTIRAATLDDAEAISALVVHTLRTSNAQDYSPDAIASTIGLFGLDLVRQRLSLGGTLVQLHEDSLIGTARLGPADDGVGFAVRTFFVAPEYQGRGFGRALYSNLVKDIPSGSRIVVKSSLRGAPFYAKLGFSRVRDQWNGQERIIEMEQL